jgi:hypothetical protein
MRELVTFIEAWHARYVQLLKDFGWNVIADALPLSELRHWLEPGACLIVTASGRRKL